jgi:hypothetical protein
MFRVDWVDGHALGQKLRDDGIAFHVEKAMMFIDRSVRDELMLTLADFIPSDFLARVLV